METLTLPRLGETMESGRVVGWMKKPGETFRRGETLAEIESDKTVVELPALASGTLLEILVPAGSDADVGAPLCRYETDAPAIAAPPGPERPEPAAAPVAPGPVGTPAGTPVGMLVGMPGAALRATPPARRLAAAHHVDLNALQGSGRRGRIEARDVQTAIAAPRDAPRGVEVSGGWLSLRRWEPQAAARGQAILLHGFAGDGQIFSGLAAGLVRAGYTVTAPDLPGHGGTTVPAVDVASLVASVMEWLGQVGGHQIELIGHSLGGAVAARVAAMVPQRVRRLTLLAPAGVGSEIDGDFVTGLATLRHPGGLAPLLRRLAVKPPPLSPVQLQAIADGLGDPQRLQALAANIALGGRQLVDIIPDLQMLVMPVRVVWGLADRIMPWIQVANVPSSVAIHLITGAGHMPHWDQPQPVLSLFD